MNKMKVAAGVLAATVAATAGFVASNDSVTISSVSPGLEDKRAALLTAHNNKRVSKCGANSLKMLAGLQNAALYHADDMVDEGYFSHNSQDPYEYWADRVDRFTAGDVGGENIAYGFSTVTSVMNAWMESTGHKRNIMDCSFNRVGFGYAQNSSGTSKRWVADFAY